MQSQLNDSTHLTLAADYRFSPPSFTNDQIWELRLQGSEPPAMMLQTSYGLRVHWMRIFPRFGRKGKTLMDPTGFHTPPQVQRVYPNFIRLRFEPLHGLEAQLEYWAISSQLIACRAQVKNNTILKEKITLEWAALLSPIDEGAPMQPVKGAPCRLVGRASDITAVMLMEGCGAPGEGPYPSLAVDLNIYPGSTVTSTWALAGLGQESESLHAAQSALQQPWEKWAARIELQNASQMIEIHSGRPDWDAALMLSQSAAAQLVMPGNDVLPHPTFVLTRLADQGFSFRGDGSDYSDLWKGQTALDTLYLAGLLLPGQVELVKGFVENFIATQEENGRIDWQPNLIAQRSRSLAQPVLATLAWRVSAYLPQPRPWLEKIYPALLRFFQAWFTPEMDQDQDGFPEWETPRQTGLEDLPMYTIWNANSGGIHIRSLEAPELAAFLFAESESLRQMAGLVGREEDVKALEERALQLREGLAQCWHARSGGYRYRDAQSHAIQEGGLLKKWRGSGKFPLERDFNQPQRLVASLAPFEESTHSVTLTISGWQGEEEVQEDINPRRWVWMGRQAHASTHHVFTSVSAVDIQGVGAKDVVSLAKANHLREDISQFLPLWAGMVPQERAKTMISTGFLEHFQRPFGAPIGYMAQPSANLPVLNGVSPLWVELIGQGLLAYGDRTEACQLLSHTLDGIAASLERFSSFHETYDADSGRPGGERNHLRGLAPLGLFLQVLGIEKLTSNEIFIDGFNPFPFQVTVKYQSTLIACHASETVITFFDGQTARISGKGKHRVTMETNS